MQKYLIFFYIRCVEYVGVSFFSQFSKHSKCFENKQFPVAVTAQCISCFLYSEVDRYEYQYSRISGIRYIPVPKYLVVMLPVHSLLFTFLLLSTSIPNPYKIYTLSRFLQIDLNTGIITFRLQMFKTLL